MAGQLVEMDSRSRVTIPGHSGRRYFVTEHANGVIELTPAVVVPHAQEQYDDDAELRDLLSQAAASPTVRQKRTRLPVR